MGYSNTTKRGFVAKAEEKPIGAEIGVVLLYYNSHFRLNLLNKLEKAL